MIFKKSNYQDKELKGPPESEHSGYERKHLVIYILKRIFYYLTILHGVMTILFLLLFFPVANRYEITEFYLYFSLIVFIVYGSITYTIHLLQKSYIKAISEESRESIKQIMKIQPEVVNDLLQGKTLQVYWYIFTHNHAGIREIQKALNFTSSGTVSYQVTKLLKVGIITKDEIEGKYSINKEVKLGVLRFFIRIGNRMVPRISLYLIIYILGFTVFLFLAIISGYEFVTNPLNLFLLLLLIAGIIIFVIESYKIWKLNPIK